MRGRLPVKLDWRWPKGDQSWMKNDRGTEGRRLGWRVLCLQAVQFQGVPIRLSVQIWKASSCA